MLVDVTPAVVSVSTRKILQGEHYQLPPAFQDDPFLKRFFGEPEEGEARPHSEGLGSGVIVSKDGYIITNNHVVKGVDSIVVRLDDGREFEAELVGADSKTDVAVLKIEGEELPTLVLADSDQARVGDVVFAVGNPLRVGLTVTQRIVSATNRTSLSLIEEGGYENFLQTDAAINLGNSGGALVDAEGRVLGINPAILSQSGGCIGIGFAIPG
ncbi:MAG: trypsin-like serine protease, partial [Opitutae bacterium]|nr:trypsin-like serine protease [Opitutae bacterium]